MSKKINKSVELFSRAQEVIPGGVNSPVRAFKSVGGNPIFIKSAKGAYLFDENNNSYVDYINSWGPMILGHNPPEVLFAIQEQMAKGISFGTPTELEVKMAELITKIVPGIDKIRMVNSGTEACMTSVRLARAYTQKNKIIKFEGCYHGHSDTFLIKAGSGAATLGEPNSPGVTQGIAQDTLIAEYNNLESVKNLFDKYPSEIACIIIEPVAGNMGCIEPKTGFLQDLKNLCKNHNSLLIFDEVMTGFRLALGGVQELYKIEADLVCFGKIIGGGLPVGAVAAKKEIMDLLSPVGKVYQAGTLSGNPLAMQSGYATLQTLYENPNLYEKIDKTTKILEDEFRSLLFAKGIEHKINRVQSMFSLFFCDVEVTNFSQAQKADNQFFKKFFKNMLGNGVYLPPSSYESWFISSSITDKEIEITIDALKKSIESI